MDHRYPAVCFVGNLRLSTKTHNLGILDHGGDHVCQTIREDLCVGVNHENNLVEIRWDAGNIPQSVEHLELELCHALIEHDLL